jgi:hypothetical protein
MTLYPRFRNRTFCFRCSYDAQRGAWLYLAPLPSLRAALRTCLLYLTSVLCEPEHTTSIADNMGDALVSCELSAKRIGQLNPRPLKSNAPF